MPLNNPLFTSSLSDADRGLLETVLAHIQNIEDTILPRIEREITYSFNTTRKRIMSVQTQLDTISAEVDQVVGLVKIIQADEAQAVAADQADKSGLATLQAAYDAYKAANPSAALDNPVAQSILDKLKAILPTPALTPQGTPVDPPAVLHADDATAPPAVPANPTA